MVRTSKKSPRHGSVVGKSKNPVVEFAAPSAGGEGVMTECKLSQESQQKLDGFVSLRNTADKWRRLSRHAGTGRHTSLDDLQEFHSATTIGRGSNCRMSMMARSSLLRSKEDICLQPTYKLDPTEHVHVENAEIMIRNIMEANYEGERYDVRDIKELTKGVTNEIKEQIQLGSRHCGLGPVLPPRTKLAVQVYCGQRYVGKKRQSFDLRLTSRSLWRSDFDQYVEVAYTNEEIWAVAVVFFHSID